LGKTARVFQLGPVETIRRVTLPYAAPYLFTGVKLAIAYAFIGVIGAEFIMSSTGLGYEIRFAYDNLDNNVMYPLILLILLIAVTVNMSLDRWDRALQARRGRV
jgi:NitT/TauT family transport system permease protein